MRRPVAVVSCLLIGGLGACHLLVGTEDRTVGVADASPATTTDAADGPTPDGGAQPADAAIPADALSPDASDAACDLERPFGSPTPLNAVNSVGGEFGVTLSQDELEIFVTTTTRAGSRAAVHRSTRSSVGETFSPPTRVTELDVPEPHWGVTLSPDGLVLLVSAGPRPRFIHRAVRATPTEPFGPSELQPFLENAEGKQFDTPYIGGGGALYVSRESGPQFDLFFAFTDGGAYSPPKGLFAFNTSGTSEEWPVESMDGKTFFFASGGLASSEIVEAHRASATEPYSAGKTLSFPQSAIKHPGWISPDGCRLYLVMENAPGGSGGADVFVATRGR